MKSNGNWWGWTGRHTATEHSACCEPKITRRHHGKAFTNANRWAIAKSKYTTGRGEWEVAYPADVHFEYFHTFSEAVAYVRERLA